MGFTRTVVESGLSSHLTCQAPSYHADHFRIVPPSWLQPSRNGQSDLGGGYSGAISTADPEQPGSLCEKAESSSFSGSLPSPLAGVGRCLLRSKWT